jgi:hypothetical protein
VNYFAIPNFLFLIFGQLNFGPFGVWGEEKKVCYDEWQRK